MKIIIKIGSAVLVDSKTGKIHKKILGNVISQAQKLLAKGDKVIIITSGAVASCNNTEFPKNLRASIGQPKLMSIYSDFFKKNGYEVCQFLYTHHDLEGARKKYTRDLILKAIYNNIVPIINANDGVNSEELDALKKYADNDVLTARVAELIKADQVFLLIKESGFINFKTGKTVREVRVSGNKILKLIKTKSLPGIGGMKSKIKISRYLLRKNIGVRLVSGLDKDSILKSLNGEKIGTVFV